MDRSLSLRSSGRSDTDSVDHLIKKVTFTQCNAKIEQHKNRRKKFKSPIGKKTPKFGSCISNQSSMHADSSLESNIQLLNISNKENQYNAKDNSDYTRIDPANLNVLKMSEIDRELTLEDSCPLKRIIKAKSIQQHTVQDSKLAIENEKRNCNRTEQRKSLIYDPESHFDVFTQKIKQKVKNLSEKHMNELDNLAEACDYLKSKTLSKIKNQMENEPTKKLFSQVKKNLVSVNNDFIPRLNKFKAYLNSRP